MTGRTARGTRQGTQHRTAQHRLTQHRTARRLLFTAAATSYLASCSLGAAVATGLVRTSGSRWLHHALYISTSTIAGAAASSLLWSRSRAGWALLPAAVPLVLVPRVSARSPRHLALAMSAAPFFGAGLVQAWRS